MSRHRLGLLPVLLLTAATAAGALAAATPAAGGSLAELAAAIDAPRVGAPVPLDGPLRIGRGELHATGARLLWARGEPCGLLLSGPVRFHYRVEDPFSRPVADRNLKTASKAGARMGADGAFGTTFSGGAAVWGWDLPPVAAARAAQAGGEGDGAPAGAGEGLPKWATEILARPFFAPPSSELIAARRLGGTGSAYALLGGGEPWLLAVDPVAARLEGVWKLDPLPQIYRLSAGRHVAYELVSQPIGRPWWEAVEEPAVTRKLSVEVDNTAETLVAVRSRHRIEARRPGLGVWRVALADRTVVDDKEAAIEVLAVTLDGQPADYVHQGSELLVALEPPLASGRTTEIEVLNAGHLAIRPGKDSYWSLGLWPWRPTPGLGGELAEMEFEVRVPDPFVPFASGKTLERRVADGRAVVRTHLDGPAMLPVVAAGKYKITDQEMNGLTTRIAAYAFDKEKESRRLAGIVFAAADYFGQLYGTPYPFSDLDIIEINSWGFGQAPAGTIFITQEAYNPLGSVESREFSRGVNERIIHEVAHAWWGHVIKMGSFEEQWLTESFAEYSAGLALQSMAGGKKGEREFKELLRRWLTDAKQIRAGGSIYLANHLAFEEERDSWERAWLLYSKGPVVLHALRQELGRKMGGAEQGDRYFFALLRSFVTNFKGGFGETRHLVGILNQITQQDWQPWFERYVYGTEMPPVSE